MLAFTQNSYLLLSSKALPLWVALLTASTPSPNGKEGGKDKRAPDPAHSVIPLDCVSALMDLAGEPAFASRSGGQCTEKTARLGPCNSAVDLHVSHHGPGHLATIKEGRA